MIVFREPLAMETLKAIQDRNRESADVRALLWEVKRMQCMLLRMDQLARSGGPSPWTMTYGDIWGALKRDLEKEPVCVYVNNL